MEYLRHHGPWIDYLIAVTDDGAVTEIRMLGDEPLPNLCEPGDSQALDQVAKQLDEYFAGFRKLFDLPLAPRGTEFQKAVWAEVAQIPYGQTASYAEVATGIGRPQSARPAGQAIGHNPIAVVIPCHRVIGSDGSLTGYGRGAQALDLKRFLLGIEGVEFDAAGFLLEG